MTSILLFVVSLVSGTLQQIVAGYILSYYWSWFILPKFTSAPHLSSLDCIGVMIVTGFINSGIATAYSQTLDKNDDFNARASKQIMYNLVVIFIVFPISFAFGLGWHKFIG